MWLRPKQQPFCCWCILWQKPLLQRGSALHKVITLKPGAVTIETSEMLPWEAEPGRDGRREVGGQVRRI